MSGPHLSRRTFLRGGLGLAVAGSLAGCGESNVPDDDNDTESPPRRPNETQLSPDPALPLTVESLRPEFGRVVNLGQTALREGRPINRVLDANAADDTLLYLPSGRYVLDETWSFDGFERFGIVGQGATIVPPDGYENTLFDIGSEDDANEFVFAGIDFDFRSPETGARPLYAAISDTLRVSDVTVYGRQDVDQDLFRFDVTDPDGEAVVTRLSLPHGGDPAWRVTGCEVGDLNRGNISFVDCHIAGFPDNGLYADPPEGTVAVVGGRYENNGISNVRLNAEPGSVVSGVHVRCDAPPEGFENMRGIRLRGGDGILVERCLIEMLDVEGGSDGGITVSHGMGRVEIRDTHVHVDADNVNAIRLKSFDGPAAEGGVRVENVLVTGGAAEGEAVNIADRDGYVFDHVCISQHSADRDGFHADNADGTVRNSTVSVGGRPLQVTRSDLMTEGLTICPRPGGFDGFSGRCERNCADLDRRLSRMIPDRSSLSRT